MIYSEKFNLSWNEFDNCASNTFKELLGETDFVDVTLVSDDLKQIRAHKVILSACSPIFKQMLKQNPQQNPIIYLTGVSYKHMQSVSNFMYLGETEVDQDDLDSFMEIASKFEVKGLSQHENQDNEEKLITDNQWKETEVHSLETELYETDTFQDVVGYDGNIIAEDENVKPENGMYYCEQCQYTSKWTHDIKVHKMAKHDGIKFPCDRCEYKSSFSNALTRHKRNKHAS